MSWRLVEYYQNVIDVPGLEEALCFTYARGLDNEGIIRAFGGDPAATMPRGDLEDLLGRYHYSKVPDALLLAEIGEWRIGLEVNGFQGSVPEVLSRISAEGAALSIFWNVNGHNSFNYAIGGRLNFGFDMAFPEQRWGPDQDTVDTYLDDLPFGIGDEAAAYPAGLVLAERITGVQLPGEFLTSDMPGVILQPIPRTS